MVNTTTKLTGLDLVVVGVSDFGYNRHHMTGSHDY